LREKLGELKVERNELREKLHKLIEEAKANVKKILFRTKILKNIVPLIKEAVKHLVLGFNN
jgi:flagellar biosynthesis/type III secretory pathway protein FliH